MITLLSFLPKKYRKRLYGSATVLALLLASQVAITCMPYEQVPVAMRPAYNELVAFRNRLVRRSGLPIPLYSDSATILAGEVELAVYFAPSPRIDNHLVDFIDSAVTSVDMCIYDLDLPNVVAALVKARQRQVKVRLIVDTDNLYRPELEPLKQGGVMLIGDNRDAFMHNKFVIVDSQRVWSGSYNFTSNCTLRNDNNALVLSNAELAANYESEFNEMWRGQFGARSPAATPYPRLRSANLEIHTLFAPEDKVMDAIVRLVAKAESSVDVMAFSFTHDALAAVLRQRASKGVTVRCLFDARQAGNAASRDTYLAGEGVEVRLSKNRRGVMHHKVILIDNRYVITGSFNFSRNADTNNDENVLILDSTELAAIYQDEFRRCWDGIKGY